MEFMDRRHRSLLVQFWLTVESFKNPLESVESGSSGDEDDPIQGPSNSATIKEDISMIYDLYFSTPSPHPALASISKKHVDIIRSFARNEIVTTPSTQQRVRRSVMLAQRQVEHDMEHDFGDFERSELWFRAIGDTDFGSRKSLSETSLMSSHSRSASSHTTPPALRHVQGPSPQLTARSESSPFLVERTTSSNSNRSSLSSSTGNLQLASTPRVASSNIEALMFPVLDNSSESSRAPLFDGPDDEAHLADKAELQRMEAVRAALTDIIAFEQQQHVENPQSTPEVNDSNAHDFLFQSTHTAENTKRKAVFDDDNEEDGEDEHEEVGDDHGSYQPAAPGDLQLSYEIARLGDKVSNLQAQDTMLDTLIKKAELTGDAQELRLLRKSKSSMSRELRQLKFQKLQYEQQEAANRLISDRTKVAIVSSTVGEEEGKSVVRYLIEVQQLAPDGSFSSGWVVARRYNEFLSMHNKLRDRYGLVRNLDFPGKRLVTALSGSFVDTRKIALEKYLQVSWLCTFSMIYSPVVNTQNVIAIPAVCESEELRAFLSRESPFIASDQATSSKIPTASDLVRTVYRSVAESIDDMFFGPSMLDVMIQRLTRQAAEFAGIVGSGVNDEDLVTKALGASGKAAPEDAFMHLSGDLKPLEGETSTSTFSAPICDLILAIFELKKKNNWLRRQAIVIILQQVLGGTIERSGIPLVSTISFTLRIAQENT